MATASEGNCNRDPNFAVICNFLDRYGELIGLHNISYIDLETWIEDTKHVSSFLRDLHVRLLRRIGKNSVSNDRWEKYIAKFCYTYSDIDAWEIERFGYKHSKTSTKLKILKNLLESQFDLNAKFKEKINEKEAEEMRYQPVGRDKDGLAYWYMLDKHHNLRIYREDLDDVDAETWELVCSDRNDLSLLIEKLQNDIGSKKDDTDETSEASGSVKSEPKDDQDDAKPKQYISEDSQDSVLDPPVKKDPDKEEGNNAEIKQEENKTDVQNGDDRVKSTLSMTTEVKVKEEAKDFEISKLEGATLIKNDNEETVKVDSQVDGELLPSEKIETLNKETENTKNVIQEKSDIIELSKYKSPNADLIYDEKTDLRKKDVDNNKCNGKLSGSETHECHLDEKTVVIQSENKNIDINTREKSPESGKKDSRKKDLEKDNVKIGEVICSHSENLTKNSIDSKSENRTVVPKGVISKESSDNTVDGSLQSDARNTGKGKDILKSDSVVESECDTADTEKSTEGSVEVKNYKSKDKIENQNENVDTVCTVKNQQIKDKQINIVENEHESKDLNQIDDSDEINVVDKTKKRNLSSDETKYKEKGKSRDLNDKEKRSTQKPLDDSDRCDIVKPKSDSDRHDADKPQSDSDRHDADKPQNDSNRQDADKPQSDSDRHDADKPQNDSNRQDADKPQSDSDRHDADKPQSDSDRQDADKTFSDLDRHDNGRQNSEENKSNIEKSEADEPNRSTSGDCKESFNRKLDVHSSKMDDKTTKSDAVENENHQSEISAKSNKCINKHSTSSNLSKDVEPNTSAKKFSKESGEHICMKDSKEREISLIQNDLYVDANKMHNTETDESKCKNKLLEPLSEKTSDVQNEKQSAEWTDSVAEKVESDSVKSTSNNDIVKVSKLESKGALLVKESVEELVVKTRSPRLRAKMLLEQKLKEEQEKELKELEELKKMTSEKYTEIELETNKKKSKVSQTRKRKNIDKTESQTDVTKESQKKEKVEEKPENSEDKESSCNLVSKESQKKETVENNNRNSVSCNKKAKAIKRHFDDKFEDSCTPDDSPIEPDVKKPKSAKRLVMKASKKRKVPSKVADPSTSGNSSDSEDIPLSKICKPSVVKKTNKKPKESNASVTKRKARPVKKKKIESDDEDEPLAKLPAKTHVSHQKETQADISERDSEEERGVRRSARVKTLKAKKREKAIEYSSFEEGEETSEYNVDTEDDNTSDEDFSFKGRNARRQAARKKQIEENNITVRTANDDTPCCKCLKYDHPEMILLCDKCDAGFHTACLRPPLMIIPDGDWFCPPCEHKLLVEKLVQNLKELETSIKKNDRMTKRKERLAYVGISLDNILKEEHKENIEPSSSSTQEEDDDEEDSDYSYHAKHRRHHHHQEYRSHHHYKAHRHSDRHRHHHHHKKKKKKKDKNFFVTRSCRNRSKISYKFEEYDEMIESAIHDEMEEVKEAKKAGYYGRSRGKDISNIEGMPDTSEEEKDNETEVVEGQPKAAKRKKKGRSLTTLDIDSNQEEDDSEEFQFSASASEVPEEEEEDEDDVSDYSEEGDEWRTRSRPTRKSSRRRKGSSRFMKDFVVDSDYDSDDRRRSTRRQAKRRVAYQDFNSEEEEEEEEETDISEDTEDLCSDDSRPSKREKRNKFKKKKNKDSKRRRVIRSDDSDSEKTEEDEKSEEENSERLENNSDSNSDSQKNIIRKSKKRRKAKSSSESSSSSSDSDSKVRRSRRAASKKVDYTSLLGSESEGDNKNKKEKIGGSDKDKTNRKKKNVIKDDSSGTDDYVHEGKSTDDSKENSDQEEDSKKIVIRDKDLERRDSEDIKTEAVETLEAEDSEEIKTEAVETLEAQEYKKEDQETSFQMIKENGKNLEIGSIKKENGIEKNRRFSVDSNTTITDIDRQREMLKRQRRISSQEESSRSSSCDGKEETGVTSPSVIHGTPRSHPQFPNGSDHHEGGIKPQGGMNQQIPCQSPPYVSPPHGQYMSPPPQGYFPNQPGFPNMPQGPLSPNLPRMQGPNSTGPVPMQRPAFGPQGSVPRLYAGQGAYHQGPPPYMGPQNMQKFVPHPGMERPPVSNFGSVPGQRVPPPNPQVSHEGPVRPFLPSGNHSSSQSSQFRPFGPHQGPPMTSQSVPSRQYQRPPKQSVGPSMGPQQDYEGPHPGIHRPYPEHPYVNVYANGTPHFNQHGSAPNQIPSRSSPAQPGGRGFMIDNLLSKQPKNEEETSSYTDMDSGQQVQVPRHPPTYSGEADDEDSLSDIADIVKYVTNDEFFKEHS